MNPEDLIGKTVVKAAKRKHSESDDECYLDLKFSDGTGVTVVGAFGAYTGHSLDEYKRLILLKELGFEDDC